MSDLKIAFENLTFKKPTMTIYQNYYFGEHPLRYSAERLREVFEQSTKFIQNWCAIVIDASLDRLVFKGWDPPDKESDDIIDKFYKRNNLAVASTRVHRDALITGKSYIVLDIIDDEIVAFHNDPRLIDIVRSADDPREKLFGAKWWEDNRNADGRKRSRLNLYYPDRIEKYEANGTVSSEKSFHLTEEVENPFGFVPIVEFDIGQSELTNIITVQDALNKLFSDMMVVGEFNAFAQRYAVTNADMGKLKSSPMSFFRFPKGGSDEEPTKVGEFSASDLTMFLNAMDKLANFIAVVSRTPKHYFMPTGANISGEALIAMESPLVKKVKSFMDIFSMGWRELAEIVLTYLGKNADNIALVWDNVETSQPLTKAQEMQIYLQMGIPLETVLRRAGWTTNEITQMHNDMMESKKTTSSLGQEVIKYLSARPPIE